LIAAHLQWHLERGLRSLPLVDRGDRPAETFTVSG
jgi:DNA repair protein RecO (recombination protein O)